VPDPDASMAICPGLPGLILTGSRSIWVIRFRAIDADSKTERRLIFHSAVEVDNARG